MGSSALGSEERKIEGLGAQPHSADFFGRTAMKPRGTAKEPPPGTSSEPGRKKAATAAAPPLPSASAAANGNAHAAVQPPTAASAAHPRRRFDRNGSDAACALSRIIFLSLAYA